jgi:hypothetical protein
MRALLSIGWKLRLAGVVVLIGLLAVGVWQRGRLLSSYYLFRLDRAPAEARTSWEEKVVSLDIVAIPSLLARLASQDDAVCANAQHCLFRMATGWDASDRRRARLIVSVQEQFGHLSTTGKAYALHVTLAALPDRMSASQLKSLATLLTSAAAEADAGVHAEALGLAEKCMNPAAGEVNEAAQKVARGCLQDERTETRLRSVQLLLRHGQPIDVLVAARDSVAEVRRLALPVVAGSEDVLATDDLLSWLHDPDPEVRRICENALRGRGLEERHLRLGRLITDSRPTVRLQVLDELIGNRELEPGVWLRRLSHDSAPAVRAATLRAAAEQTVADLTDRIDQMSQNDPSPTVRQLAKFYLSAQKVK